MIDNTGCPTEVRKPNLPYQLRTEYLAICAKWQGICVNIFMLPFLDIIHMGVRQYQHPKG